jgi:predicted Zn-dependent protease
MSQIFPWLRVAVLTLTVLIGCAPGLQRSIESVTPAERVQFSSQLHAALVQLLGGQNRDEILQSALDQAVQRVAQPAPVVTLVNDDTPHLLALPDSRIIVSQGLLLTIPDADTLTALLAHALGHARHQHSLQAILRITARGPSPVDSAVVSWGGTVSGMLLDTKYTEAEEMVADRTALVLLADSGLDPQALLRQLAPGSPAGAGLGRHPLSAPRLAAAVSVAHGLVPAAAKPIDPAVFTAARTILDVSQPGYALYHQARLTEKSGSSDRALPLYLKAAGEGQEASLLLTGLGMAYLRQDALVAARQHLTRALHADNDYYYSHLGLGYIALLQNDNARAVSHLQRSLKLLPTVRGGFLLAEARAARGEVEAAIKLYKSVVAADPKGFGRTAQSRLTALGVSP